MKKIKTIIILLSYLLTTIFVFAPTASASGQYIIDINQDQYDANIDFGIGNTNVKLAQSFKPGFDKIKRINLKLCRTNGYPYTQDVKIDIYSSYNDMINCLNPLGTITKPYLQFQYSSNPTEMQFDFTNQISVTPGNTYYFTITPPAISGACLRTKIKNSNVYNDGNAFTQTAPGWNAWNTKDLFFKTFAYDYSPNTPNTPSGPSSGNKGVSYSYSTSATDPDGNQVYYKFDWGDGTYSNWVGPYNSGQTGSASHIWSYAGTYSIKAKAKDIYNVESSWSNTLTVTISEQQSNPPTTPSKPSGPTAGAPGGTYTYTTSATDPDGDQIYYKFDWGDGQVTGWFGPYSSGSTATSSHSWSSCGTYCVKVKAKDIYNAESGWSNTLTVTISNQQSNPPSKATKPNGPSSGYTYTSYTYQTCATDPEGDQIYYQFTWGDGAIGPWTGPYNSNEIGCESYSWPIAGEYNINARAKDIYGNVGEWSDPKVVTISPIPNDPPNKPSTPSGPSTGTTGETYTYTSSTTDPDGNQIYYKFYWGDSTTTGWIGPKNSGESVSAAHSWNTADAYLIQVVVKDIYNEFSEPSDPKVVIINGNQAPSIPSNPSPSNASFDISTVKTLSWNCNDPEGDEITYDLYLSTCPKPDYYPAFVEELTSAQCENIYLSVDITYYWRVVATDEKGAKTVGPIWEFSTKPLNQVDPPNNNQPNKPATPILFFPDPADLNVGDLCIFTTQVTDPDGDNVNVYWDMDDDDGVDVELLNVSSGSTHSIVYKWDKLPGWYDIRVIATDIFHNLSDWSNPLTIHVFQSPNNNPPNNASIPAGENIGLVGQPYKYSTYSVDPDGDKIKYQWDFGDGTVTDWNSVNWVDSGKKVSYSHSWDSPGYYDVKARVKDINGEITPWSDVKTVTITNSGSATIFNNLDFGGGVYGDVFDNFPGQGRLTYANGATGAFVTGAYGGFPIGHSWSTACQGVEFYTGRTKEITVDAEISYISATEFIVPAYTWLQKVIKVDGLYNPDQEYKEWINNICTVEDLQALCTAAIGIIGAVSTEPLKLFELVKTAQWTAQYLKNFPYRVELADKITQYTTISRMNPEAKFIYTELWNRVQATGAVMQGSKAAETSASTLAKSTTAGQPASTFGPLSLILLVSLEIWTLYQLMTHWQVDTLLEKFEQSGQAYTEHITKTFTVDHGTHQVWAGMQSDAFGVFTFFGFAYAAGLVKSIKIDGIAPPEPPSFDHPDKMNINEAIPFKTKAIDQNDDPVQHIIYWGDGHNSVTPRVASGEEVITEHTYSSGGTYTVTVQTIDIDNQYSEENTYDIHVSAESVGEIQINPTPYPAQAQMIMKKMLMMTI